MKPKKLTKKELLLLKMKETDEKKLEYTERQRFWQEKALEQFGYANNLFIAINIAVLGYLVKQAHTEGIKINTSDWEWSVTLLGISIIVASFSLLCGITSVLSRLYDLRLTRHIIDLRKRDYIDHHKIIYKYYSKRKYRIVTISEFYSLRKNFVKTVFDRKDNYWIEDLEVDPDILLKKFHCLRIRTNKLGEFSWKTFKAQIISLCIAVIIYSISNFII